MKVAVVDAGSNSFLILIAEEKNGHIEYLLDLSKVVGLGHLKNRVIDKSIFERAKRSILEYHALCDRYEVDKRVIVGTEIFRKLKPIYFEELSKGFDEFNVLLGRQEAELSYLSVTEDEHFLFASEPIVEDIGGGSVEFAYLRKGKFFAKSFLIGAMALTNKFVKKYPVNLQLNDAMDFVHEKLELLPSGEMVSIGGTGTTIASILERKAFDSKQIHGKYVKMSKVEELYEKLRLMDLDSISRLKGMQRGREKIITAGTLIFLESVRRINGKGCYISVRGHRYTVAKDILERNRDSSSS